MTMTKAAAALLLNQDNDFASLVWKTVVENDYDGFLRALDDAGLAVGDLTLSQQEFDNMIKGVKPSGELDLAVWTGYYEVADGKSLDPLAFLILPSSPTTVYWGSRSDIMNAPKKCAVKYSLSSDAKLELATSLHGRVSIQFTRQYQEASDTVASSFTGKLQGGTISGSSVSLMEHPTDRATSKVTAQGRTIAASAQADPEPAIPPVVWDIIWVYVPAIITFIGGIKMLIDFTKWIREGGPGRQERSNRISRALRAGRRRLANVAFRNCDAPTVDFEGASERLTDDVTSRANQELADDPPDFDHEAVERTTERLRPPVREAGEQSLRSYVRSRVVARIEEQLDRCKFVGDFDGFVRDIVVEKVNEQAHPRIEAFGPETSYDPAIRPAALDAREAHYRTNYNEKEAAYNGAEQDLAESKQATEKVRADLEAKEREIEEKERKGEDATNERARKAELERDLEKATEAEKEKQTRRDEAENDRREADEKRDKAEEERRNDRSKEKWDEKVKDALKKP